MLGYSRQRCQTGSGLWGGGQACQGLPLAGGVAVHGGGVTVGRAGVGVGYAWGPGRHWGVWGGLEGAGEGCPGDEGVLQGLPWAPPGCRNTIPLILST